jgi:hypothetical protein
MATSKARGSAKASPVSEKALRDQLKQAQVDYEVKWWWFKGSPWPDLLRAGLVVKDPGQLGSALGTIASGLARGGAVASYEVIPMGVTAVDGYHIGINASARKRGVITG